MEAQWVEYSPGRFVNLARVDLITTRRHPSGLFAVQFLWGGRDATGWTKEPFDPRRPHDTEFVTPPE